MYKLRYMKRAAGLSKLLEEEGHEVLQKALTKDWVLLIAKLSDKTNALIMMGDTTFGGRLGLWEMQFTLDNEEVYKPDVLSYIWEGERDNYTVLSSLTNDRVLELCRKVADADEDKDTD